MEQPQPKEVRNNTESFFQENKNRYESHVFYWQKARIRYLIPRTLEKDSNRYEQAIADALQKNLDFFGEVPIRVAISFVESSEDFQRFVPKKQKGDFLKGYASGTRITMLTPDSYGSETNFTKKFKDTPENRWLLFRNTLSHEFGHTSTNNILAKGNNKSHLPGWFKEAIASRLESNKIERKNNHLKNIDEFINFIRTKYLEILQKKKWIRFYLKENLLNINWEDFFIQKY